ncbi:hypothetical protein HZ994_09545 [Akkermansiaceae bacterium]|nr:hypothetical protein HZ994_00785 [Akkermansiaceae bacterium]QTN32564.1 hypothetical protein HZ994_09545 [Akkermansiaceae bacterium]
MIATTGCSDPKASTQSTADHNPSLEKWSQAFYRDSATRKENLRCETESFLFSIGTDGDWTALFFKDKRTHPNSGVSSSAYFVRDGRKIIPTVGDAGDGRTPGLKLLKTLQVFDGLLFEYQVGERPTEEVVFSYRNGKWLKPENNKANKTEMATPRKPSD